LESYALNYVPFGFRNRIEDPTFTDWFLYIFRAIHTLTLLGEGAGLLYLPLISLLLAVTARIWIVQAGEGVL
jgi:hypothetical protein